VSGLARGIDTAAHEGAMSAGGKTAAVLGCAVDIIYPPGNLDLYRRMQAEGAILSEFPLGRRADRQSFAMRNRIVAGMSEAVVVIESDVDGGAMITARFAGEQGRLIFAVPGRIDQSTSAGCHQLIRDGATLMTGVDDLHR
jgi:DNA processing protein